MIIGEAWRERGRRDGDNGWTQGIERNGVRRRWILSEIRSRKKKKKKDRKEK